MTSTRTEQATAAALRAVRQAILTGDLAPGEQVRQQAWSDMIGVSRPPLREALAILANEGLLMRRPGQGYFVAKFSMDEMRQLYTMRLMLENEALKTIVWPGAAELERLEGLVEDIEQSANAGRPDSAMERVVELYLSIYRLSRSQLITAEIERLWSRTAGYRSLAFDAMQAPAESAARQREIVEALRSEDSANLTRLMLRPTIRRLPDGVSGAVVDEGTAEPRRAPHRP